FALDTTADEIATLVREFLKWGHHAPSRFNALTFQPFNHLQLVVGQAHRVQERVPTRVVAEIFEKRIAEQIAQTGVGLPARAIQPLESPILFTAIPVNFANLKRG